MYGIQAQRVDVKFRQPIERVLDKEAADFIALRSIKIDRRSPGSAVTIRKIRAVFAQVVSFRAEVVINHVQRHRKFALMAGVDEPLQPRRPAITLLNGKGENAVIPPVPAARELRNRHQLNDRDAQPLQIIKMQNDGVKRVFGCVRADVKLIEDITFQGQASPARIIPLKSFGIPNLRRLMDFFRLKPGGRIGPLGLVVQTVDVTSLWIDFFNNGPDRKSTRLN